MFTKQKTEDIKENNQRLNIDLAVIYFLLVILFISLLLFL